MRSPFFPLALPLVVVALFTACSSEDDKTHLPGTSGTTGSGGSSASVTAGSTSSGSSGGGGDATSSTSSGSDLGYCGKACSADADCCPAGLPNCPGPTYPYNYTCNGDGICDPPTCTTTADCSIIPNAECHPISGYGSCFVPCTVDDDCVADLVCAGAADDGTKYCTTTATGCAMDVDCHGYGKCFTGACRCQTDADCTGNGVDTCVK